MNRTFSIFIQFFANFPGCIWLVRLGLLLLPLSVLAALLSDPESAYRMAKIAFILLFAIPYMSLPGYFRHLISNKRLSLIPGFHFHAGLALLLYTMLTSVFLQAATILPGLESLAPGTALFFFIAASAYMGYSQITLTMRYAPYCTILGALAVVYGVFLINNNLGFAFINTHFNVVLGLFLLSLAGWTWSLYLLATRNYFRPAVNIIAGQSDKEAFKSYWDSNERYPQSSTSAGTLLLGLPDGYLPLLIGGFMWVVVFPGTMALAFLFFNLLLPGDPFPPFTWTFLPASAFLGACSTLANGEFAARSRLLWLRFGTDRAMLWQHMEKVLWRSWCGIYLWALVVAGTMMLLDIFSYQLIVNYLIFIPACSFYLLYLSLLCRISKWHELIKAGAYMGSIGIIMVGLVTSTQDNQFLVLNSIEAVLVAVAVLLRFITRSFFTGIDWYQIQPINLSRFYQKQGR